MKAKAVRAAQRAQDKGSFRGKYKGPDRFKGDEEKIKAWKAKGRIGAKYKATSKKQAKVDTAARPERPGTVKPGQMRTMEYTPEQAEWDKKYGYAVNRKKGKGKGKFRGKHLGWKHREQKMDKKKQQTLEDATKRLEDTIRAQAAKS